MSGLSGPPKLTRVSISYLMGLFVLFSDITLKLLKSVKDISKTCTYTEQNKRRIKAEMHYEGVI